MSFIENRQSVSTDKTNSLLHLLEIAMPVSGVFRVADDTRDWESNGNLYLGFPFGFRYPEEADGQSARLQLVVANVGRTLTQDLDAYQPGMEIMAKLMVTDRSDPNAIFMFHYFPLLNVSANQQTLTAYAGVDFKSRQQACKLRFNQHTTPGL